MEIFTKWGGVKEEGERIFREFWDGFIKEEKNKARRMSRCLPSKFSNMYKGTEERKYMEHSRNQSNSV